MTKNKFLANLTTLALVFSVQVSGLHVAQSAVISTPTNIVVRAGTNTNYLNGSLTVTWDAVTAATAYAVLATRAGSTSIATVSVSGEKNNQAVVTGLVGGATYVVQVRAIQDQDVSPWSSNSLVSTPTTLPKAVNKPTVEVGVGSATVNWVQLVGTEDGGSSVTSYVVTESNSGKSLSVAGNISTVEFTDLTQDATAIFQVKAITAVSTTGSTSVASDEVTILSSDNVSPEASASPSASAQPTSPIEITSAPTSGGGGSSGGGSSGGGSSGGGGGFGGGGGAAPPLVIPSPPNTESPAPTASPSPSTFIPADKTPLQPSLSPSPRPSSSPSRGVSPSPKTSVSESNQSAKGFLATTTSKANLTVFTAPARNASLTVKSDKNLSVTLPTLKKGTKVISKVRAPNGAVFTLATITVKKTGSVKLPTVDFKKPGTYQLVTFINGKSSTLKITVKK
jgi:uncharacterized membrane protein YgcG